MAEKQPFLSDDSIEEFVAPDCNMMLHVLWMHVRKVNDTWKYPEHKHGQYELNVVVDGEQIMTVDGVDYHMSSGDILLIPPENVHASKSHARNGCTYFCLHFEMNDADFLNMLQRKQTILIPSTANVAQKLKSSLHRLVQYTKNAEQGGGDDDNCYERMMVQAVLFELFADLSTSLELEETKARTEKKEGTSEKELLANQIADRIRESVTIPRLYEEVNPIRPRIEAIANELGISNSYCHRVFRECYQMSPRQYLSQIVLDKAKRMLHQKDFPVEQIAQLLGYSEYTNFSRQFKRWTGYSPKAYRRQVVDQ